MIATLPPLIYTGSVKDVHGVEGRNPYVFAYSDRYSIFDWGAMPDELPGKGEALAVIADLLFRYFEKPGTWSAWKLPSGMPPAFLERLQKSEAWGALQAKGLRHHSRGLVDAAGKAMAAGLRSRYLAVEAVEVKRPREFQESGKLSFDYSAYAARPVRALVPLEVIFRFGAPEGSSFLGRAEKEPSHLAEVGLTKMPREGEWFERPIVEFSTKLEPTDRALRAPEARAIAGLNAAEFAKLEELTILLAIRLKEVFQSFGAELWDGKFEFAFLEGATDASRDFQLVDSIGPDELRVLSGGVHLSKEVIRQIYKNSAWNQAVQEAKRLAKQEGTKEWKKICRERLGQAPKPLPEPTKQVVANLYPSLTNEIARALGFAEPFQETPAIAELLPKLKEMPKL